VELENSENEGQIQGAALHFPVQPRHGAGASAYKPMFKSIFDFILKLFRFSGCRNGAMQH
jgi:hypothetical protein